MLRIDRRSAFANHPGSAGGQCIGKPDEKTKPAWDSWLSKLPAEIGDSILSHAFATGTKRKQLTQTIPEFRPLTIEQSKRKTATALNQGHQQSLACLTPDELSDIQDAASYLHHVGHCAKKALQKGMSKSLLDIAETAEDIGRVADDFLATPSSVQAARLQAIKISLNVWSEDETQCDDRAPRIALYFFRACASDAKTLNVLRTTIQTMPQMLGQMTHMTHITIMNTKIKLLPSQIGQMINLNSICITNSDLQEIPAEIGQLEKLWQIVLESNKLKNLPAEIGALKKLRNLDLSNNKLTQLRPEIGDLCNLRGLDVSDNPIAFLCPEIGSLKKLTWLDIANLNLEMLPHQMENLTPRLIISAHGNRLDDRSKALLKRLCSGQDDTYDMASNL